MRKWFSLIVVLSIANLSMAQTPFEALHALGTPKDNLDLEKHLGANYRENVGGTRYKMSFSSHALEQCVSQLQFEKKLLKKTDSTSTMYLKSVSGQCTAIDAEICPDLFPGIDCSMTKTEVMSALETAPNVSEIKEVANMYNEGVAFKFKRADGNYIQGQFRFRSNKKKGKINKKRPTKLVAYTYEFVRG